MKAHLQMMARYNRWANERLYRMAASLTDADYRRDTGTFFDSLHGTLNHLMAADLIWMRRFTGEGEAPSRLNAIVHDDLDALHAARRDEDARIIAYVESLQPADIEGTLHYRSLGGGEHAEPLWQLLAHLFNHQTHHRGQAHAILTRLGIAEPEPMDLVYMLREEQRA